MFTAQEKGELSKLVEGVRLMASSLTKLALVVGADKEGFPDDKRSQYASAMNDIFGASEDYMWALSEICWCYIDFTKDRQTWPYPQNIAHAKDERFAKGQDRFSGAIARLTKYPEMADAKKDADAAKALFDSFDWTMPYASPFPAGYPKVVGPHGDYDTAQAMIIQTRKYIQEAGGVNTYAPAFSAKWSPDINPYFAQQVKSQCIIIDRQIRIMGLNANIECADDTKTIDAMTAAGSGIRTREFFSTVLTGTLFRDDLFVKDFRGATTQTGAAAAFRDLITAAARVKGYVAQVNGTTDQLITTLTKGGGFFFDITISWVSLDAWMARIFMFIHEISKPPAGQATIPLGFFESQVAELDKIAAEATVVKAELKGLEGTKL